MPPTPYNQFVINSHHKKLKIFFPPSAVIGNEKKAFLILITALALSRVVNKISCTENVRH